jgi:hypothetical protein
MSAERFIEIGGKRYTWRDILALRREQVRRSRLPQPTLFELKEDRRPSSQRSATGRYAEPTLFEADRL